jgi:uncharacterized protein YgiM (DUF1202 family)
MPTQHNRLISITVLILFLSTLALSACNLPFGGAAAPTEPEVAAIYTSAALTLQVQLTQNAPTQAPATEAPPAGETQAAPTPPAVETPVPPTAEAATPTQEATPTELPVVTVTPMYPTISASQNTNCREGPSKDYKILGMLAVGQTAEVYGRNSDQTWWYIQNLSSPGQFCWIWNQTTTVVGNTTGLAVITPPPPPATATLTATPGAGFSASFSKVHDCSGTRTAIFQINNTGGTDLESLNLKIVDQTSSTTLFGPSSSDAPFMGSSSECPPGGDTLEAGKTLYVGGGIGSGNSGHTGRATIKLCTDDGLGGTCIEKTVDFTIP